MVCYENPTNYGLVGNCSNPAKPMLLTGAAIMERGRQLFPELWSTSSKFIWKLCGAGGAVEGDLTVLRVWLVIRLQVHGNTCQ